MKIPAPQPLALARLAGPHLEKVSLPGMAEGEAVRGAVAVQIDAPRLLILETENADSLSQSEVVNTLERDLIEGGIRAVVETTVGRIQGGATLWRARLADNRPGDTIA